MLLASCAPDKNDWVADTYAREILKVQNESETRAIVFAVIKNTTPPSSGAQPTEFDKRLREDGIRFRYVVEKTDKGWKVSQVFRYFEMGETKQWNKIYDVPSSPSYPAGVADQ
jgi:hypothetical protein